MSVSLRRWRRLLKLQERLLREAELRLGHAQQARARAEAREIAASTELAAEQQDVADRVLTGVEAARIQAAAARLDDGEERCTAAARATAEAREAERAARARRVAADVRKNQWEQITNQLAAQEELARDRELQHSRAEFALRGHFRRYAAAGAADEVDPSDAADVGLAEPWAGAGDGTRDVRKPIDAARGAQSAVAPRSTPDGAGPEDTAAVNAAQEGNET